MPHELFEWQERIKAVEREHSATRLATDRLLADVERDPTVLTRASEVRVRDIRFAAARLDGTYILVSEMPDETISFSFGKNWAEFVERHLTEERIANSRAHLLGFLDCADLRGKHFLDIGSGSGLSSLAAFDAGAERVVSFDIDPESVATTRLLRERRGDPGRWTVLGGSVLDKAFVETIEPADIVYSWGVLHHTGRMWEALANAISRLRVNGLLYVALYTATHGSGHWLEVKRRYNAAGPLRKRCMEFRHVFGDLIWPTVRGAKNGWKIVHEYPKTRGMSYYTDVKDWLGGLPYEFAKVEEVFKFCRDQHRLELVNLATGEANNEYLFHRRPGSPAQNRG